MDQIKIRRLQQEQLAKLIYQAIPVDWKKVASNLAKKDRSIYVLLKNNQQECWLTLRLADHPIWLLHAQQLTLDLGNPLDLLNVAKQIKLEFSSSRLITYTYVWTMEELTVLRLLYELQQKGLVFAIHLKAATFLAFKAQPLDLQTDFMLADLFLTQRNNVNKLKIPVTNQTFQQKLALLFGRNLLFSQFSRHHLLKLLPTNQWIQPVLRQADLNWNYREGLLTYFGQEFYNECQNWL